MYAGVQTRQEWKRWQTILHPPPREVNSHSTLHIQMAINCFREKMLHTAKNAFLTFLSCFQSKYLILKIKIILFSVWNKIILLTPFAGYLLVFKEKLTNFDFFFFWRQENKFYLSRNALDLKEFFRYIWTRNKTKFLSRKAFFTVQPVKDKPFI